MSKPGTRISAHFYQSPFRNESRILKETKTLIDSGLADHCYIAAVWEEGLPISEDIDSRRHVLRFPLSRRLRLRALRPIVLLEWMSRVFLRFWRLKPVVVEAHSLATLPLAVALKLACRSKLIYAPHELETESIGMPRWLKTPARILEKGLIGFADGVCVVGPHIAAWYRKKYGLSDVVVVRNMPYKTDQPVASPKSLRSKFNIPDQDWVFIYQGLLGDGRGVPLLIEAFRALPRMHLIFMGYGKYEGLIREAEKEIPNIHFLPAVAPSGILQITQGADVGISMIENACLSYFYSLPNKIFEYLQAGIPVLVSDFPEMGGLVDEWDSGWKIRPETAEIQSFLKALCLEEVRAKKDNVLRCRTRFGWEAESREFIQLYSSVLAGQPPPRIDKPHAGNIMKSYLETPGSQNRHYQICVRCIMDTSDPEISFGEEGHCNHCVAALERMKAQLKPPQEREAELARLVNLIKAEGQGKDYDCIIGVSGGVDSTMVAYQVKQLGLRPLAVHFDNGWNSELAVDNIRKILETLKIDLYTYVVDWDEFRDLQLAFLKANVVNCESPTDHGITATLFKVANREKVRFILSGSNLSTEAIMPISWAYYNQDLRNLRAIHAKFATTPLKTFPTISVAHYFYYVFVKRIRQIPFLNYIAYNKDEAKSLLASKLGWRDYGGKHYESVWTRFYQGHYLPTKFGFDKRRAHLSTMICSGQVSREDALKQMEEPAYDPALLREDADYVLKKFRLSSAEFDRILHDTPKPHFEYPSNYFLFHKLRKYKNVFRKIATSA